MANTCGVGSPSAVWGSTAFTYLGADGVTESGSTGGAVEDTAAGSETSTFCPFNVRNPGTVSMTAIYDATVDIDVLVNTEETLTLNYPITNSGNATPATKVGLAILTEAGGVAQDNVKAIRNFVWRWSAAPVYTPESA